MEYRELRISKEEYMAFEHSTQESFYEKWKDYINERLKAAGFELYGKIIEKTDPETKDLIFKQYTK